MCKWTIGGITCRCSLLFPAVLLVLLLIDDSGIMGYGVLAAFVHECGHIAAMLCCREKPQSITVSFYGIRIAWGYKRIHSAVAQCCVALAGPLINFFCAALLSGAENSMLRMLHIGLAVFNLIPLFPLDGAVVVCSVLGEKLVHSKGYVIAEYALYILLIGLGAAVVLMREHNPTMLITAVYMFILRLFYKRN